MCQRLRSLKKVEILIIFKIIFPDHIFIGKSMKLGMEVLHGGLFDISSVAVFLIFTHF